MTELTKKKSVIVIGAGVIGLSAALRIQEDDDFQVTILAETLPSDPLTIKYTSLWAGAHHLLNYTENDMQQNLSLETFKYMWDLSAPGNEAEKCFLRVKQTEYYCRKEFKPALLETMPDYEEIPKVALPPGAVFGCTFSTLTIDSPIYLNYLMEHFVARGGKVLKGTAQHINQVIEGGVGVLAATGKVTARPDAVVVCTGLGSRFLGGLEDRDVFPVRGQTVLIRAPWVRFGRTLASEDATWTYIIPRRSGDVIVGGTKGPDDWYPIPRPDTTEDILKRAFALCPELAPPEVRAEREPTLEDVRPIVVGEGCGLRPVRTGGIRLEVEWMKVGREIQIPVVYNYGHGGYGFQSSWGSANKTLGLLKDALSRSATF